VRDALGGDVPGITDNNIQEALWHYFYDVEKSVNYLLQSRTAKKETSKKKAKGGSIFSHFGLGEMDLRQDELANAGFGVGNSYRSGGASPLSHHGSLEECQLTKCLCRIYAVTSPDLLKAFYTGRFLERYGLVQHPT
jgi:hypothetical protein